MNREFTSDFFIEKSACLDKKLRSYDFVDYTLNGTYKKKSQFLDYILWSPKNIVYCDINKFPTLPIPE